MKSFLYSSTRFILLTENNLAPSIFEYKHQLLLDVQRKEHPDYFPFVEVQQYQMNNFLELYPRFMSNTDALGACRGLSRNHNVHKPFSHDL